MSNNSRKAKSNDMDLILGIETKRLEDGTTVLKMGNNTYEFPITVAAPVYKRAA